MQVQVQVPVRDPLGRGGVVGDEGPERYDSREEEGEECRECRLKRR